MARTVSAKASFTSLAHTFARDFSGCVRVGHVASCVPGQGNTPPKRQAPSPFDPVSCSCGEQMARVVQFWYQGRLWCYDFCFHCQEDHWDGLLRSVAASADLPEDSFVEGTDAFELREARYLADPGTATWDQALAAANLIEMMDTDPGNEEEFFEALAYELNCDNIDGNWINGRTHLGGQPSWIQAEVEHACPACQAPMALVAQLESDTCFHWGDAGAAYLFACSQHPEHTATSEQMC